MFTIPCGEIYSNEELFQLCVFASEKKTFPSDPLPTYEINLHRVKEKIEETPQFSTYADCLKYAANIFKFQVVVSVG